jgi:SHS2 domain-containing protein
MANLDDSRVGYETIAHTADVGLRVRARSLPELFEQAALGLVSLMLDARTVRPVSVRAVRASAQEPEELLVAWLSEILFLFDTERFAPASVRVGSLGEGTVTGELRGEQFDRRRHRRRHVVKAVTYHDLTIRKVEDVYEVQIIFDV